ncbi:histidine phosphatase family protein [Paenibacillus sp. KQZ6P-2]|uniref:Histidine phosphatase family protein n=1 Tax=Paenibacillus mangrovi TaxID=2931978 RepID=A0A9X1WLV1_9BACL|nr:histidine phosphatase family protein [Paenibacillus mangrovi]MCJ8010871.1 histidine phosphatase family protein [Paenibacillus mangrovi]
MKVAKKLQTVVYMVRHAESQYVPGLERERGLSDRGCEDALKVKDIFRSEIIDVFFSSAYRRALQTLEAVAREAGRGITLIEDLRERTLASDDFHVPSEDFFSCKKRLYEDFEYALPGGESSSEAQSRGVQAFLRLLDAHQNNTIVVGTHGDIMTLIMNYFDPAYDFEFWRSTSMPDIYKLTFETNRLIEVARCWAVPGQDEGTLEM